MTLSPTLSLAKQLIAKASVTPADAGCQTIIRERLEAIGFTCTKLTFGEGAAAVDNLWAIRTGDDTYPLFCFAGHTDVVPSGPITEWHTPPFEPTLNKGMLYGRGAADMKGSLAAMVAACEQFVAEHPAHRGSIALLITADEEGPAKYGTVKVVEWLEQQRLNITWCLVGEPSSTQRLGDTIKNGRRGSLGGKLRIQGKQGHVAYPHLADNPIHRAAPALAELANAEWDQGNDFFPATGFQITNIQGGTGASNVIPSHVDVTFNFRFSTESTADALKAGTEAILHKHGLDYTLQWQLSGQPFLTAAGELVEAASTAVEHICGYPTQLSTAGGTSDGRFIAPTGAQVVELGPVNATIHQVNECVKATDLDQLSQVYRCILQQLLTDAHIDTH